MFTLEDFGILIIDTMTWAAWAKTVAFGLIWYILMRQDSARPLGKWINRMFLALMVTSIFVSLLTGYLGKVISRPPTSYLEWFIVAGLNIAPLMAAGASGMVAYHSIKSDADQDDLEDISHERDLEDIRRERKLA